MANIKYQLGQEVIVNTGGADAKATIFDHPKSIHGYYWKEQDCYLCKFENNTRQYMRSEFIKPIE